jgi:hypothetical protein
MRTIPTELLPIVGEVSANSADTECHVFSVTDPYSRILGFIDRLLLLLIIIITINIIPYNSILIFFRFPNLFASYGDTIGKWYWEARAGRGVLCSTPL